jgi:hypothetical protein
MRHKDLSADRLRKSKETDRRCQNGQDNATGKAI